MDFGRIYGACLCCPFIVGVRVEATSSMTTIYTAFVLELFIFPIIVISITTVVCIVSIVTADFLAVVVYIAISRYTMLMMIRDQD